MTVIERYNADGLPIDTHVTIVDEARAAYQRQRAERDQDERQAAEEDRVREQAHTRDTLGAVLGLVVHQDLVEVHGTEEQARGRVTLEGGLVLERAQGQYLRVIWACSVCGAHAVPSPTFRDLAGLGWILEEGVREGVDAATGRGERKDCFACERQRVAAERAAAAPEISNEAALVAALVCLIDERVGGGVVGELMTTQYEMETAR